VGGLAWEVEEGDVWGHNDHAHVGRGFVVMTLNLTGSMLATTGVQVYDNIVNNSSSSQHVVLSLIPIVVLQCALVVSNRPLWTIVVVLVVMF